MSDEEIWSSADARPRATNDARRARRPLLGLLLLPVVLLLAGCSGQGGAESQNAVDAALRFATAVQGDAGTACDLLAPGTRQELEDQDGPCPTALPDQNLPRASGPGEAEVYGKDAIVRLSGDTIFLARFDEGWRVTAAGCVDAGKDKPYSCSVKGN
ncbi:hypothetical protein GCM10009721_28290 [Terrabacter tumescens]|uniref:Uncharacterized protein n=1 Tax=Terrabacter tumescens TaxID=60443 RepID=A0ABQ2I795_9MICO|nr:hypothetical protein [Terrabacter tumescens]GGM99591.1 hypothetical protein GCM10009721_28290 [Terrabacter tumescens]